MAHTRLMQLHSALGDRSAALQAFERCRAVLERELSAEPSSETMMLAERIRSQTSPVREPVMHEAHSPREAWEFPLTGRAAEHRALVTAFQTMLPGRMQVATIEGEPGIGKTRLAREFLRACLKRGDSRGIEAVHLEYEKQPTVSNRSDRPPMGLYQRPDSTCKTRR